MKLAIRVSGVEVLRQRVRNAAECATSGALTRRGLGEVGRIVTRAQKNLAPVRKGRVRQRELDKRLKKGMAVGKATRLSSVAVNKFRALPKGTIGPRRLIKPGLIKRSIGYRIIRGKDVLTLKMGMNVGKKRSHANYAPHRSFVGKGTKQRKTKPGANRGVMPRNFFIANAYQFAAASAIAALNKTVGEDMRSAFNLQLRPASASTMVGAGT